MKIEMQQVGPGIVTVCGQNLPGDGANNVCG
jgi:hypothetical protein